MWSSNVLRLRSCSSGFQHGLKKRWYNTGNGEAVGQDEFIPALGKVLPRRKWHTNREIGLAVSGGVDSMALATLYSKASRVNRSLPECHGFIIDHKVRPESTEEANWVAHELRSKFGMRTTIIPLTWPDEYDRFDFRHFETDARKLRYRALGNACASHKITELMVAHHADDQAETVMMRLMNLRWRSGLQGMQGIEWIPECYGVHGVHHSGDLDDSLRVKQEIPFPVERGGIQILRPLLGFEKRRLIRTCEENGTSWAEDKTNQIQTLTARNAIRHVFHNHKLPAALSIKSLVQVSQHMQSRIEGHKAHAENVFDNMPIRLDIQTGALIARLPPPTSFLDRPIVSAADKNEARNNAYFLLERLAELVSPREKAPISQLANAVLQIYPTLASDNEGNSESNAPTKKNFCVFSVWWRLWDQPSPFDDSSSEPHPMDWLLSRQPLEDPEHDQPGTRIVFPPASDPIPLNPSTSLDPLSQSHLYDGRFWVQLRNNTPYPLILRPINDEELLTLSKRFSPSDRDSLRYVKSAISLIKPWALRRHIPALFQQDPKNKQETIIALPTIDTTEVLNHDIIMDSDKPPFALNVRYKKINTGKRQPSEIVLSGIRHSDIIAEEERVRLADLAARRSKQRRLRRRSLEEQESDPLPGYKKVGKQKTNNLASEYVSGKEYAKKVKQGSGAAELDGLGFLEAESEKQAKPQSPRKIGYRSYDNSVQRKRKTGRRDFEGRI